MISINDNGRPLTAVEVYELRKQFKELPRLQTPDAVEKKVDIKKHLSALDLHLIAQGKHFNAVTGHVEYSQPMRKGVSMNKQIRKAVRPENLVMRANGIPDASLALIKIAHKNGKPDPHTLSKGGVNFPSQSSNAINDRTRAIDGARLAGDSADDEGTQRPLFNRVGGQVTTDVSGSANIQAADDAIRQDLARGPKRFL